MAGQREADSPVSAASRALAINSSVRICCIWLASVPPIAFLRGGFSGGSAEPRLRG